MSHFKRIAEFFCLLAAYLILASCGSNYAFAQPVYCNINSNNGPIAFTATGNSPVYVNSQFQCHGWVTTYASTGLSGIAVSLQGSNDNSTFVNITALSSSPCANPSSADSCTIQTDVNYRYYRIHVVFTGTGTLYARAYGTSGITAKLGGGSGGATGPTGATGATGATGPAGSAALGTAFFNVSGGVISNLSMTGVITSVTRTATGKYAVGLTGVTSANYKVTWGFGDDASIVVTQISPVSSYTTTGFSYQNSNISPIVFADVAVNFIVIAQ